MRRLLLPQPSDADDKNPGDAPRRPRGGLSISFRRAHQGFVVSALLFTGVLFVYSLGLISQTQAAIGVAGLGLIHSAVGFYWHGGTRISAPGAFLLAMGLFGYFPTLYYLSLEGFQPATHEILGLSILFSSQILLYAWWSSRPSRSSHPPKQRAPGAVWVTGAALGLISLAAGVSIELFSIEPLRSLDQPAGYAGVTLTAVSLVQANRRVNAFALASIAVLFSVFVMLLFYGGGRLVLGSLAMALTMAVGLKWRPAFVKPMTLAVLPPGVLLLAQVRANSVANYVTGYRETGLESVVWPQRRFLDVLADVLTGAYPPGGIDTFASTATSWVPRSLWPEKPVGFGLTLAEIYRPELLSVGHSEAALLHGEFVYSWVLIGLPFLLLVTGFCILRLDYWLGDLNSTPGNSVVVLIKQSAAVVASSGLVDLVWVGTYTYAERAGFTCAVLGVMYVVARLLGTGASSRDMNRAPVGGHQRLNQNPEDSEGAEQRPDQKAEPHLGS